MQMQLCVKLVLAKNSKPFDFESSIFMSNEFDGNPF